MATIFPTSPAPQVNDEYQGYRYNGTSWDIIGVDLTGDYQTKVASVSSTELGYLDGVTSAVQTQLNAKSPLASPTFTGTVTIPAGASISGYATETYVETAVSNLVDSAPSTLNTLNELAAALADDANFATTITNALSPIGSVTAYAMDTPPAGWLLCDGTVHNISSYPTLGAGLGSTYGGNGTTTFAVPNLKGRIPVGLDSAQTEFDTRGETGGAKTHTLTEAQMPQHTHTQNPHTHGITDAGHLHTIDSYASDTGAGVATVGRENVATGDRSTNATAGNTTTVATGITINNATATNQNTGSSEAHNNLQPYIVMNYIIRAV